MNAGEPDRAAADAPGPLAIVAGHGRFAEGLVSAVHQITGRGDAFVAVSNSDQSGDDIAAHIGALLEQHALRVVFTDLPAGSCTMAVRRLQRTQGGLVLATGANVGVLLEFLFAIPTVDAQVPADATVDLAAIVRASVERARGTLSVHGG